MLKTSMLKYIYVQPIVLFLMAIGVTGLLWPVARSLISRPTWLRANAVLSALTVIFILYATILNRALGDYAVILTPFATLIAARRQPELYREMLMNVFLFFPLGLTLSNALPRK